jgi:Na+-translocating ferredoxin:NAD+ oxidoreductase RnfC subunit
MEIVEKVKENGVVGAGGGGFPTHIKLATKCDTVIINGVECEPLLASDRYLLENESEKVVGGLEVIMRVCGASRGFIALSEHYVKNTPKLHQIVHEKDSVELIRIEDFYPAGEETILVHEVTGRIVPEGGIPPDVGCIVENVETALNLFLAIAEDRPVTIRHLTCTGEVRQPAVVKAHVGTAIGEVIELCGGVTAGDVVFAHGGPLMGTVQTDLDTPVNKSSTGIIVLPRNHDVVEHKTMPLEFVVKRCKSVCHGCGICTSLCPLHMIGYRLEPHRIMRQIGYGIPAPEYPIENALLCSGCGLCSLYACTMGLAPYIVNRGIRNRLLAHGFRPIFPSRGIVVNELREYRKIPVRRLIQKLQLQRYAIGNISRVLQTNPDRVEIPLEGFQSGPEPLPVVNVGDKVKAGSPIARIPGEALGAAVHSSIGGMVTFIDRERVIIEKCG